MRGCRCGTDEAVVTVRLRDEHVALNLVYISYTMLHTIAVALSDAGTASLAKRAMIECAKLVAEVDGLLPTTVFRELQGGDFGSLDSGAPEQSRSAYREAWIGPETSERAANETAGRGA